MRARRARDDAESAEVRRLLPHASGVRVELRPQPSRCRQCALRMMAPRPHSASPCHEARRLRDRCEVPPGCCSDIERTPSRSPPPRRRTAAARRSERRRYPRLNQAPPEQFSSDRVAASGATTSTAESIPSNAAVRTGHAWHSPCTRILDSRQPIQVDAACVAPHDGRRRSLMYTACGGIAISA